MTTASKRGTKYLTQSLNAEALRRTLMESYFWNYAQLKDFLRAVERKEKEMRADGEL